MNDRIYPPRTTALVLIDVLNDFLAEDGKLHASIAPMLEKTGFVAHVARLLEGARAAGVKIIFAPHGTDERSSRFCRGVIHGNAFLQRPAANRERAFY